MKTINMGDLLRRTREVIDGLVYSDTIYVLTRNKVPVCVMVPVEKYKRLTAELKKAREKTTKSD